MGNADMEDAFVSVALCEKANLHRRQRTFKSRLRESIKMIVGYGSQPKTRYPLNIKYGKQTLQMR